MEKLKPCPFCGREADCNNTGILDHNGNALWWVECICGVNTDGYNTQDEAATVWNRRVENDRTN